MNVLTTFSLSVDTRYLTRLITSWIMRIMKVLKELTATFKESGFKGVLQKYGWKLVVAFFVYYLVRDITLYVVIPYLVYQGFAGQS